MQHENIENKDHFDFCLQSGNGNIVLTILINGNPLYDCIMSKHAQLAFSSKKEQNDFFLEAYNFEIHPQDELDEEELFYHNFPQNLSPVDEKHIMIGLDVKSSFFIFTSQHIHSSIFDFSEEYLSDNSINDLTVFKNEHKVVCLLCSCGVLECANVSMKISVNDGIVTWSDFYWFDENFHKKVFFNFNENQYISTLLKIKQLTDDLKTYEDYQNWLTNNYTQNGN